MPIRFYDNRAEIRSILADDRAQLDAMFERPELIDGEEVRALEADIAKWTGAVDVVAVNSATDGLIIALMALGIGQGDEVIVPAYSFFSTASSVAHVGATPVFVDIDPQTYAMQPEAIADKLSRNTKAIMPVHLFSQMAAMPPIQEIARQHKLHVIEDSAEAIGMFGEGAHAGTIGDVGVFSFFPTKTLAALGDGGVIVARDREIGRRCRQIASAGAPDIGLPGAAFPSRMDEWQAFFVRRRLLGLPGMIAQRRELARLYTNLLRDCPDVVTPAAGSTNEDAVFYVYLIQATRRDDLARHLSSVGIETEVYYPLPLHLQPVFRELGYREGDCPVAEAASRRALALPMYPELGRAGVEEVVRAINEFYGAA